MIVHGHFRFVRFVVYNCILSDTEVDIDIDDVDTDFNGSITATDITCIYNEILGD